MPPIKRRRAVIRGPALADEVRAQLADDGIKILTTTMDFACIAEVETDETPEQLRERLAARFGPRYDVQEPRPA